MGVLAAIDNSRCSDGVLDTARRIAGLLALDVDAVTVREGDPPPGMMPSAQAGVPCRALFGDTATAVLRALEGDDVALAVLGAGRSRPMVAPVGHVTRDVITEAAKDLVVVPAEPVLPRRGRRIKVVVPVDGAEATTTALARELRPLIDHGVEVVALHVFDAANAPVYWDHFYDDYRGWQQHFGQHSCPVPGGRLELDRGSVATAVRRLAAQEEATLVAIAWAQDLSPGHARIVTELLASSPVPLLLVPVATHSA